MPPPIQTTVFRYADLLVFVPNGGFFDIQGTVVPLRDNPYVLQLTTEVVGRKFGVFLNGVFQNVVTSDAVGNVTVSQLLPEGENVLTIVDSVTQERTVSYLTCRNYATLFAAYAARFEQLDSYLDQTQSSQLLEKAIGTDLQYVWGPRVQQPNPNGYDTETYRELLQELHQAQRLFASKLHGHEVAVAAFTQVPPLDYVRIFTGKRWVLGQNFLENGDFTQRSHSIVPAPGIPGIQLLNVSPMAQPGAGFLVWVPGFLAVTYHDPVFGSFSVILFPNLDGVYKIAGPTQPAAVAGPPGPFTIVAGSNQISFEVDHLGMVQVGLPLGVQTAAALATAINAALAADPRYGGGYGAVAGTDAGGSRLHLQTPNGGPTRSLVLYPSAAMTQVLGPGPFPQQIQGTADTIATVNVVYASLPAVNTTANFTVFEAPAPDGWFFSAGTSTLAYDAPPPFAEHVDHIELTSTAGADVSCWRDVRDEAADYKGFEFNVTAWFSSAAAGTVALGWSFDGGLTWNENAVTGIVPLTDSRQLPQFSLSTFIYVADAQSLIVRFRATGLSPGQVIKVYKIEVKQPEVSAAYLKRNTIPRSRHRSFFGHLLWSWCSDPLGSTENAYIGIGAPPNTPKGQLDFLSACHTQIDRFDVTQYDLLTNQPINLVGVINEAEWSFCTLTNLTLVPRSPSRFSYVTPTVAGPQTTATLVFPTVPPFLASFPVVSDQDITQAVLTQDGVPVTQDNWSFSNGSTILVQAGAFVSGSVYILTYNALYQAESPAMDLGPTWQDYVWFADYYAYQRYDAVVTNVQRSTPLFVDFSSYTASLDRPANTDPFTASIVRDDGSQSFEISRDNWAFLSPFTIGFDGSVIKTGALYTLTYEEVGMANNASCTFVFEIRKATTAAGLAAATYVAYDRNSALHTSDGFRFFQIRVTIQGIKDLRDLRLRSMVAKGLDNFGLGGTIPGLRP